MWGNNRINNKKGKAKKTFSYILTDAPIVKKKYQ